MTTPILVLGATGNTGRSVVADLERRDIPRRSASRSARPGGPCEHVIFDWYKPSTWDAALDGVERLYLVAPIGDPDPAVVVAPFLHRARRSGVRRVVTLSSSAVGMGDPGLGQIDALVAAEFPQWTVLRPSWFMQNFVGDHPLAAQIRAEGRIVTATGDGRLPFVDADDIGRVAAAVLTHEIAPNAELLVTGPEALSYADAADLITQVHGIAVHHEPVSSDARAAMYRDSGYDGEFADALAGLDESVRRGDQAEVTATVENWVGRVPRTLREFLVAHRP